MRWLAGLALGAVFATGCASPLSEPRQPAEPVAIKNCGTEEKMHGQGYDGDSRKCLWQGYVDKEPVQWETIILTGEGDPILWRVVAVPGNRVELTLDTTQDGFGDRKVTTFHCVGLQQETVTREGQERWLLKATGCDWAGEAEVRL